MRLVKVFILWKPLNNFMQGSDKIRFMLYKFFGLHGGKLIEWPNQSRDTSEVGISGVNVRDSG